MGKFKKRLLIQSLNIIYDICRMNKKLNYILILVGGAIALYAQAQEEQNQYFLIGGIFVLMIGLYRLSREISQKNTTENDISNSDTESTNLE